MTDVKEEVTNKRELNRLAKEPFKTRYEPLEEQARDRLRGFIEPNYAYVLLERWEIKIVGEGEFEKGFSIAVVNVQHRPEQAPKFERLIRKGFRILHWGNFPKLDSKDADTRKLAEMHKNAWINLEESLVRLAETTSAQLRVKELASENASIKAERDALLAKVAEQEKKAKKESVEK